MCHRIQSGTVEPLEIYAQTTAGAPATGLSTLVVRIRRDSDGFYLDWADDTFKSTGWTTINGALTELDATNAPGLYGRDFDTSAITNKAADDVYTVIPDQTSGNTRLPSPAQVYEGQWADQVNDIEVDTQNIQSRLPAALVGGRIDSDVGNMQTGTVTAAVIATDAIDADAISTDALGSLELATSAVNEIRDAILADSTPFNGADIAAILADTAAMDARLPSDPADESLQQASHTATQAAITALNDLTAQEVRDALKLAPTAGVPAAGSVDEHLDDILTDTAAMEPLISTNLDAAISSRGTADPGDAMALVTNAVDSSAVAASGASEIAYAVWEETLAAHTGVNTTGEAINRLDDDITSRSAPGDAMALTPAAVDGIWDEPIAGHLTAGTTGKVLDDVFADTSAIDARLPSDPADESLQQTSHSATQAAISALNNLAIVDVQTALTNQGYTAARAPNLDALDVAVSTRAATGAAMALTAGAVDAIWDESIAGHLAAGTTGKALDDAAVSSGLTPQQVRDAMKLAPTAGAPALGSIDEHIDDILADTAAIDSRLPSDPADESLQQASHAATQSVIAAAENAIRGVDSRDLSELAGAGFSSSTDTLEDIRDAVSAASPTAQQIADAVWEESLSDHSGTSGSVAEELAKIG